ncbi:methylenetetrahydrofolate reductase, partial [Brucella abortus]|nr:methylenetetrahydrofolate reductase [Brucella abortus]
MTADSLMGFLLVFPYAGFEFGQTTRVSFEFFPPKTEEVEQRLWETVTRL